MKKILVLLLLTVLAGCGGITDMFSIPLPPTAKEIYEGSGGNQINLHQANPVSPVTVSPVANGNNYEFTLADGCLASYDITTIAGSEAPFWLLQPVTLTYDSDMLVCGANVFCDFSAIMIGSVADVTLTCTLQ